MVYNINIARILDKLYYKDVEMLICSKLNFKGVKTRYTFFDGVKHIQIGGRKPGDGLRLNFIERNKWSRGIVQV